MRTIACFTLLTALVCSTLHAQEKTAEVLQQYDRAATLQNRGDYGPAAEQWAKFMEEFPQSKFLPQALFNRGECFYYDGKKKDAAELYVQFLAKFPDDDLADDALYALGLCHADTDQPIEAGRDFDRFLEKYPQNPLAAEVAVRRATLLSQEKKYAEAAAHYASIASQWPDSKLVDTANLAAGKCCYLAGNFAESQKMFEKAVAAGGESLGEAAHWLVRGMIQQNQPAEAAAAAETLIPKLGDTPQAAQLKKDRADAANLAAEGLYRLGWTKIEQNDHAAAEKAFDALVAKYPDHKLVPRARYVRAIARHRQKNNGAAVEDLLAFLADDPTPTEKSDARYLLGQCQAALQKPADAVASFQAIVEDDPKYKNLDKVFYEMAWALEQQDKKQEAVAAFARLAAEHPDSPRAAEAQYRVGESAYKSGDFKKAAIAYHEAWRKAGKTELGEKAACKLGWSYFRLEKFLKAQQSFLFQRITWPDGPLAGDAALMEGESLWKLQKPAEARAAYERVIAQYPQSDRAPLAKQRIEALRQSIVP